MNTCIMSGFRKISHELCVIFYLWVMNVSSGPLFSVILPTYNREVLLHKAVQSVLNQGFPDWQLIIVDDGSTDNTAKLVSEMADSRIKYVFQPHSERSTARNTGIKHADGKYLCFLDDDDYYQPDFLKNFYDYYRKDQFPDQILRQGFYRKNGDKKKFSTNYDIGKHKNPVNFAAYHMCGVWSLSIPKKYLDDEKFHPDFPHWQDTHLILRLFARYGMTQLPFYTYVYVIHEGMGSKMMGKDLENKIVQNTIPVEHLFSEYGHLINPLLNHNTKNFLLAKKYIEFAHYCLLEMNKEKSVIFIKKSLSYGIFFRLWRYYLVLLRDYFVIH